jgi:hypothetical protein
MFSLASVAINNTPKEDEKKSNECLKQTVKNMEPYFKDLNKRGFINSFIDKIPELSYYEAAQLKKKLGDIYVEWNDT